MLLVVACGVLTSHHWAGFFPLWKRIFKTTLLPCCRLSFERLQKVDESQAAGLRLDVPSGGRRGGDCWLSTHHCTGFHHRRSKYLEQLCCRPSHFVSSARNWMYVSQAAGLEARCSLRWGLLASLPRHCVVQQSPGVGVLIGRTCPHHHHQHMVRFGDGQYPAPARQRSTI
jgi:hypothetical protein